MAWGRAAPWTILLVLVAGATNPAPAEEGVFTYKDPRGVQHFTNVPTTRKFRSFSPPDARLTLLGFTNDRRSRTDRWPQIRVGREMKSLISETAYRFDIEPALIHAVVRAESGFDPQAVSSKGARGLMQLMPGTALEVGVRDVFHPRDNLEGGASYLRGLLDRYQGNVHLALAAYNAGPGAVDAHGGVPPYSETQEYLRRVFRFRQEYLRESIRGAAGTMR